ncbi:transposase [Sphingosinicellaceae bacterium]|nr:transposase [Sphingosinicellaceae bacterium]
MAHTTGIESFWAMLKRGYEGFYRQMSPKHVSRYVTKVTARHNARNFDTFVQARTLARGVGVERLRYIDLVAGS